MTAEPTRVVSGEVVVLMDEIEFWRPVPHHPGYEASQLGRVRSLRRTTPRVLKATTGPCGFATLAVSDTIGGGTCRRVGSLVALAWVGPLPHNTAEIRRLDGNTLNDRADNLAYGTFEDVLADHAARARREEAAGAPTHCPDGHRYADLWLNNWGDRLCEDCWWKVEDGRRVKNGQGRRPAPRRPLVTRCPDCRIPIAQHKGGGGTITRCPDCSRQAQRDSHRRQYAKWHPQREPLAQCVDCLSQFPDKGIGVIPQRCAPCNLAHIRRKKAAQASSQPITPAVTQCPGCGVDVAQHRHSGGIVKWCRPCGIEAKRAAKRKHGAKKRQQRA